jgi:Ca2+-binding RTX toxin-like protein
MSTQGNIIRLKYSEIVTAESVSKTAFAVAAVDSRNKVTTLGLDKVHVDQNDPTQLLLTLSGTNQLGTASLRVSYIDPLGIQSTGVIQDQAGNDASSFSNRYADILISGLTTILGSQYKDLVLTGNANINGTGNAINNIITGNSGNNILDGGDGVDTHTGLGGLDIFHFSSRSSFGASTADHITDFQPDDDLIQVNKGGFKIGSGISPSFASVSSSSDLATALASAATFVYDSSNGNLYWNQNGTRSGFGNGGIFAVLDNCPTLTGSNISLV